MSGFNLGDIFVTFKAKTEDVQAGVAKVGSAVQGVEKTVNNTSFKAFTDNAQSGFSTVSGAIQNVATKLLVVAGASSFGAAHFINLAGDLQTTQQRMASLAGSTDDAQRIMGQLYQYVLGKPIAFPEASKAAATLLGYGVAAKDVVAQMKTLSAFSIVNGADMGQLSLAMGQVQAKGHLMGQEIIQLTNNFVPVSQVIAKYFNVSIADAMKMMDGGKISAADFSKAMANFIPQDEIEKQSNTFKNRLISLQGSIRSFGLAMIGVKMDPQLGLIVEPGGVFDKLSGFLPVLADGLKKLKQPATDFVNLLVNNADTLKNLVFALAAGFAAMKVAEFSIAIGKGVVAVAQLITGLQSGIGVVAAFNAVTAMNPFVLIAIAIGLVIAALVFLQLKFNIFGKAWDFITAVWGGAVQWFQDVWNGITSGVAAVGKWIGDVFSTAANAIGGFFGGIWNGIVAGFNAFIDFVKQWGPTILAIIFWPFAIALGLIIMNWGAISGFFGTVWNEIVAIWSGVVGFFTGIIDGIVAIFTPIVQWFINLFALAWIGIQYDWNAAVGFFTGVWNAIAAVFGVVGGFFAGVFQGAWNAITSIFGAIGGFFRGVWNTIVGIFTPIGSAIGNAIGGAVKNILNTVIGGAVGIINGFIGAINGAIGIINNIPGVHIGKLGNLPVPKFSSGIENFAGGLAYVHGGEVLANLAPGTSVIPKDKVGAMGSKTVIIENVNIQNRQDADYLIQRINRNLQLESMGVSPVL